MTKDKNVAKGKTEGWPQVGDVYFTLVTEGVYLESFTWNGGVADEVILSRSKIYKTANEAKLDIKRQRLITRYLAAIKKHNKGWLPVWESNERKYYHKYNKKRGVLIYAYDVSSQAKTDSFYLNVPACSKFEQEFTDAEMKLILTGEE